MPHTSSPFYARLYKPLWLLICPESGRTAVYSVFGDLMAEAASDELVEFGVSNFTELTRWDDLSGANKPNELASWMEPHSVGKCFLFTLRDVDTAGADVAATPDR